MKCCPNCHHELTRIDGNKLGRYCGWCGHNLSNPDIRVQLKVNLDAAGQPHGQHQVRLHVSEYANQDDQLGGLFRVAYEIEILRGSQRRRRDGGMSYRFEVDSEKVVQLHRGLMAAVAGMPGNN